MNEYRIELRSAALRALRKLNPPIRDRLRGAITLLAQDPRPPAARPLKGQPGWRVRVGDHRILHTVQDDVLLVVVVTLGHRREIYDRGGALHSGRARARGTAGARHRLRGRPRPRSAMTSRQTSLVPP
ncbi:hypothetical protein BH20ACT3_BH20ACT3_16330 [soil metagenome]